MLQELEDYYKQQGILSTSFTCKFKNKCRGDCADFTGPKSAFVSSGYENRSLPRLLFLSLDSGSGDKNDNNRLPFAVREQEEINRNIHTLHKSKHWYRTHELAWYVLKRFDSNLYIDGVKKYFAHANSAKCCMNKVQRKKANAILFNNCKRYLKEELKILSPDIVISQGHEAKNAVWSLYITLKRFDEFAAIIKINENKVFWLHTYHPANYGSFNKQRNFDKDNNIALGWHKYSELIFNFINVNA